MRENTERPEGVEAGVCKLVGTSAEVIYNTVTQLLDDRRPMHGLPVAPTPSVTARPQKIVAALNDFRSHPV